jgi:proteasome lid subunit RPN8/RPN11
MTLPLKISSDLLAQCFAESIKCHPAEGCGFLLGKVSSEARIAESFIACRNIQDDLHAKDPERYPRTAATAYVIDSKEQDAVFARATSSAQTVIAIVHSHPEHGAYFSAEDKANAAPWGEPLFPEMSYVVISVYDKVVTAANDFCWDETQNDFVEHNLMKG